MQRLSGSARSHPFLAARRLLIVILALAASCMGCVAQQAEPRLKAGIREGSPAVIPGSAAVHPRGSEDLGALGDGERLAGVTLVLQRSDVQEADLQALLRRQQDVKSPLYHQWLTPDSFGARFGFAEEDLLKVQSWLVSQGFTVDGVSRSRDRITFSGTAGQIRIAFGSEIHRYGTANGEVHIAPEADLKVPSDLAAVTMAVLHLSDLRPKPNVRMREQQTKPAYTSAANQARYLAPGDLMTMYDMQSLVSKYVDGEGQSIAVLGQSYIATDYSSPVQNFSHFLHLRSNGISPVLVPNSGVEAISPGDEGESEIDVEYAGGMAPGAQVFVVYVGARPNYSVFDALAYAIDTNLSPVLSISYSICEGLLSPTDVTQNNALLGQAMAQGQTVVAASGDRGSTGCAEYSTASGLTTAQIQALAVGFPSDSPDVTAVGGTQMAPGTFGSGNTTYWASATGSDVNASLLSYVPEVVWNEDAALGDLSATGGGASLLYARPAWQAGIPGLPAGTSRLLPDVALQASVRSPGFLLCTDDASLFSQEQNGSCTEEIGENGIYPVAGGTSFAAPTFAAMLAVVNQAENALGQGAVNPILYGLAANPATYAAVFHDVQTGSNACAAGIANCSQAGQSAYSAAAGFDEATGLGSVDVAALVKAWPATSVATKVPSIIELAGQQYTASPGSTTPIVITLATNGLYPTGLPTGSLSISIDGSVVATGVGFTPATNGSGGVETTYNFIAPSTPGSHLLRVDYGGDATYAPSSTTASVLIGNVEATGSFTLAAGNLSILNGSTGSESITLTPNGGYSGRVTWTLNASATSTTTSALSACYRIASELVNGVTAQKLTIGVGSACNSALPQLRTNPGSALKAMAPVNGRRPSSTVFEGLAGCLLCCGIFIRSAGARRLPRLCTILTCFGILGGLGGCGGSTPSSSAPPGQPPPVTTAAVVYNINVAATDSVNKMIYATTQFTLTVQ